MYSDTKLMDWFEMGDDKNVIDNLQAIEWKVRNRKLTVRAAIAECLDVAKQDAELDNDSFK